MTSSRRALPALLIAVLTAPPVAGQAPPDAPARSFIEVSGTGVVQVAPDLARISFAVETQATAAAAASAQNADRMDAVIRALRGLGVGGLTVETFGYALRPDYAPRTTDPERGRMISGYTALNNIRVTLGDIGAVGRAVDAAIQAGANRVSSLTFEATDTETARNDALTMAVARARREAETMAAALGRELGEPLEVRGGAEVPSPRFRSAQPMMAMEAADTPVEAGDLNVTATVFIRFALGGSLPGEGR